MASPQIEHGYTKIANELLEHIYSSKFSTSQLKILLIVIRYSYGFSQKYSDISNSFISNGTGIHEVNVSKEINALIKDKVLIELNKPSYKSPRRLMINKDYEAWQNHYDLAKSLRVSKKTDKVSNSANLGDSNSANLGIANSLSNKENIIKKEYKEKEIKENASADIPKYNERGQQLNSAGLPIIDDGVTHREF